MKSFVKLTENERRIIIAFFFIFIFLFVLIGIIGGLIIRVMKWQGKRLDTITYDVVKSHVIDNKKDFKKYATKKNWQLFFLQSWKPLLIILVGVLFLIIRDAVCRDFSYNVWDYEKTGFNTLLFVWDFSSMFTTFKGGFAFQWPTLLNTPHWSNEAWVSYIFVPCMLVGGIWYLVSVQCVISRSIRMHELMDKVYGKSLEGYNQNDDIIQDKRN